LVGAREDINAIRRRARLHDVLESSKTGLLAAIEQERGIEFFGEWGHRFFDLKRWGIANEILGAEKANWDSTDVVLPIPQSEILLNRRLTQNDGY
jgi:hypothetical protein